MPTAADSPAAPAKPQDDAFPSTGGCDGTAGDYAKAFRHAPVGTLLMAAGAVPLQALRESEARFRSLTLLSASWYWEQDDQFRFVSFEGHPQEGRWQPDAAALGLCRWEIAGLRPVDGTWVRHRLDVQAHRAFRELEVRSGSPRPAAGVRVHQRRVGLRRARPVHRVPRHHAGHHCGQGAGNALAGSTGAVAHGGADGPPGRLVLRRRAGADDLVGRALPPVRGRHRLRADARAGDRLLRARAQAAGAQHLAALPRGGRGIRRRDAGRDGQRPHPLVPADRGGRSR